MTSHILVSTVLSLVRISLYRVNDWLFMFVTIVKVVVIRSRQVWLIENWYILNYLLGYNKNAFCWFSLILCLRSKLSCPE